MTTSGQYSNNFPYVVLAGPAIQVAAQDPSFWPDVTSCMTPTPEVDPEILAQITITSDETTSTDDTFNDLDIKFLD